MDIGQKGGIDEAIRHRAFDNEIIVTCFTDSAVRWMVHYGRMVQALGFDHFVVLTNDPPACDAFRKAWCSGDADGVQDGNSTCESTYPGCAWYTPAELDDAEGWTAARIMNVEALWLWRYHVAVEFLRRGVNVLMSDLDGESLLHYLTQRSREKRPRCTHTSSVLFGQRARLDCMPHAIPPRKCEALRTPAPIPRPLRAQ